MHVRRGGDASCVPSSPSRPRTVMDGRMRGRVRRRARAFCPPGDDRLKLRRRFTAASTKSGRADVRHLMTRDVRPRPFADRESIRIGRPGTSHVTDHRSQRPNKRSPHEPSIFEVSEPSRVTPIDTRTLAVETCRLT